MHEFLLKISLKFIPKVQINNIPALVQIMAWRRPADKPLSEPMMVSLLTHIFVTWPQWVKMHINLRHIQVFYAVVIGNVKNLANPRQTSQCNFLSGNWHWSFPRTAEKNKVLITDKAIIPKVMTYTFLFAEVYTYILYLLKFIHICHS